MPHLGVLLRTAGYLTRNSASAEDLVQETMVKAMRHIDQFTEGTDARAWLLTILRRTHIDGLRAAAARVRPTSLEAAEIDPAAHDISAVGQSDSQWANPTELMERFEDQDVINALNELPDDIRWTLLLVDVEQLDQALAAGVLEVPVGTVKSRVHRGRAMLRDRLHVLARKKGWVTREEAGHA